MAAETVQEFLVALGWSIKGSEERAFSQALDRSKVAALALSATLVGLVATIAKVAEGYEQLFYQSQRVGASVENIQAFDYAISQVGGSAAGAAASLEGIGSFLRSSPGAESLISRLGVQTRDANGGLRDTATMLTELGTQFRAMPYYRARAYAGVLGIDERTLQALIRGTGEFSTQLRGMYQAAGISSTEAARGSAAFMQQLRGLGAALQVLRDKVALSLERGVGGDIERLRKLLVDNFGRISNVIVAVTKFVIGLGAALVELSVQAAWVFERLADWFNGLDAHSKRLVESFAGLLVAWRVLGAGFLSSPLGRTIALLSAFLLLLDDYSGWQEGKGSAIDWSKWDSTIQKMFGGLKDAAGGINEAVKATIGWQGVFEALSAYVAGKWLLGMLAPITKVSKALLGLPGVGGLPLATLALPLIVSGDTSEEARKAAIEASRKDGAEYVKNHPGEMDYKIQTFSGMLSSIGHRAADYLTGIHDRLDGNFSSREALGASLLSKFGLDADHVAAMLGNAQQESSLDPTRRGYNGKGEADHWGLFQWDQIRADQIKSQFGIDIKTADFATQIKAAVLEGTQGKEQSSFGQFLATPGLAASAGAFADKFERSGEHPGEKGYDARLKNARRISEDFSSERMLVDQPRPYFLAAGPPLIGAQDIHNHVASAGPASVATTHVGGSPRINSTTTINVSGAGQPDQVARSVARQRDYVAEALVRNMGPLAR